MVLGGYRDCSKRRGHIRPSHHRNTFRYQRLDTVNLINKVNLELLSSYRCSTALPEVMVQVELCQVLQAICRNETFSWVPKRRKPTK
jgi:hypothetical protein